MARAFACLLPGIAACLGVVAAPARSEPAAVSGGAGQVLVLLRLPAPHSRLGSDYGGSYGDGAGRAARRRIAAGLARDHGLALVDDWPMPLLGVDCFIMSVPEGQSLAAVSAALSSEPGVAGAQPVNLFHTQGRPVDASAARADPLLPAQPTADAWHLKALHKVVQGRGVRVAVVDSRIDTTHPDLAGQVVLTRSFVTDRFDRPEEHGTAVAGIIAAIADNGIGIAGVAPRARLLGLRACWQRDVVPTVTVCDTLSLARALHFAVEADAQIVNLSLSGPSDALLARLLDVALARGMTIVAAVDPALPRGGFPASYAGVVAVTDDVRAPASPGVYVAPGRGVPATQTGGRWYLVDGSSYAAAEVSGLLALVRGRRQGIPLLVSTLPNGGAIDSCATLRQANGGDVCAVGERLAAIRN